jgi:hypothetical protein
MYSLHSLIDPGGGSLAYHLDRLRRTLDGFRQRLRQAVADALGQTVGDLVRDSVASLLDEAGTEPPNTHYPPARSSRQSALWNRSQTLEYEDDPDDLLLDEEDEPVPPQPRRLPWPQALAAGLRSVAWGLERRMGRLALGLALGLGVAACVAVLVSGPRTMSSVGLVTSALSLARLDDLARFASDLLATLAAP